jgi:hypothetical protein
MKKSAVLLAALVMLAVTMPVVASESTWSGELTYGFITDFTDVAPGYGNAFLSVTFKADDNNSVTAELDTAYIGATETELTIPTTLTVLNEFTAYFGSFYGVSDLAGMLGLKDMGLVAELTYGWVEVDAESYSVSGYGKENVAALGPGATNDTFALDAGYGDMAVLRLSTNPRTFGSATPDFLANLYGTIMGVKYSVEYYTAQKPKGQIGGDLAYSLAMGDITADFDAEVAYDTDTSTLSYGAGVAVGYGSLVSLGAGFAGTPDFGPLGINATLTPMEGIGLDVGMLLDFSATDMFQGLDISATKAFGAGTLRVGYLITSVGAGDLNAPATLPNGGLYITYDIVF